jgi:hypothetical protein
LTTVKESIDEGLTFENMLNNIISTVIKTAIDNDSRDNISCIFLCFDNLFKIFTEKNIKKLEESLALLNLSTLEFNELYDDLTSKLFVTGDYENKNFLKSEKSNIFNHRDTILTDGIKIFPEMLQSNIKKEKNKAPKSRCCEIF